MTDLSKIPWKGLAVLLACVAAGRSLVAQEPAAEAPAPPVATETPTPSGPAADADSSDAPEGERPAEPKPRPAAATGSPQRFEPSERVRPDFDVAFPIDI